MSFTQPPEAPGMLASVLPAAGRHKRSLSALTAWNKVGIGVVLQALPGVTWVCPAAVSSTSRILSCQGAFHTGPAFLAEITVSAFLELLPLGQGLKTSGLSQGSSLTS